MVKVNTTRVAIRINIVTKTGIVKIINHLIVTRIVTKIVMEVPRTRYVIISITLPVSYNVKVPHESLKCVLN